MANTTIPRIFASRKPPPPTPPEEPWHKCYGSQDDGHGNKVRNWTNWRSCTCPIGDDHDDD